MRTRTLTIAMLLCLSLLPAAQAAAVAQAPAIITDVSLQHYPRVTVDVMLPSGESASGADFEIQENGKRVEVGAVKHASAKSADIVLLMDCSGSMRGKSMSAAVSAAKRFLTRMDPSSRIAVVSFADRPKMISGLSQSETQASAALDSLSADGETALYDALTLSAKEGRQSRSRIPIGVLLSDGGDTVSRSGIDEAIKALRQAHMPVIVVGLPSAEADFGNLKAIAKQTGGRFLPVSSLDRLERSYAEIAKQVTTAWSVTYTSRRPATADLEIDMLATVGGHTSSGSTIVRNPSFVPGDDSGPVLEDLAPANRLVLTSSVFLIFASVFGLVASLGMFVYRPKTALADMRFYDQLHGTGDDEEWSGSQVASTLKVAVDQIAGKRGIKRAVHEALERAGLRLRPTEFISMHVSAVIGLSLIAEVASGQMMVGLAVVVLVTVIPILWLSSKMSSRRRRFDEQLPDTLSLLASSLRAGWGLQHAFGLVIEQMADPIAGEFARANTEIRLGRSVDEALFSIADRLDSTDFRWTATAIAIQKEVGGNLAETLDNVAATMRERSSLRRHIAALVAEGRLSALILVILPFILALLLSVVNPGYMGEMVTNPMGIGMLVGGCVLLIVGMFWLRRAIAVEV